MTPPKVTEVSEVTVRHAATVEDIRRCYDVFKVLRPHLTSPEELIERVQIQFKEGYKLAYIPEGDIIVACMGYRVLHSLAWERFVYIDDLVTMETSRGRGYGGKLLDFAFEYAREQKCTQVHLDSGYQRFDAHRLYLNKGFKIVCHHFSKKPI
jgi:GNAT superfamily N-acetyltransferase